MKSHRSAPLGARPGRLGTGPSYLRAGQLLPTVSEGIHSDREAS